MPREDALSHAPSADALIVRSSTQVDAEFMQAAPNLKAVARAGTGVDNVDLAEASKRGIVVMNTPGGNTLAAAEHAFALMLSLVRHIPAAHQALVEGRWARSDYLGSELNGKTLGIVGFGRIGQEIAKRAQAFNMTVITHDPYISPEADELADQLQIERVDLNTLLSRSDAVTLHAYLSDETRGMMNAERLAMMKRGAILINTSRGPLVEDAALAEAVRSGHLAGAGIDVYDVEPVPADNPLIGLTGIIHTPHLGASTIDAQINVAVMAAEQIADALLKGEFRHVVNAEVLAKADA